MKSHFNDAEYKETISDRITLELTDESDAEKLLGIQVDMKHEGEE
jgi:hypothetical protein